MLLCCLSRSTRSQNRAIIACLLRALSLSFDALTFTLSAPLTAPTTKRTPRTFQTIYAHCPLLLMPAGWQAILRGLLSGGSTQQAIPAKEHNSHRNSLNVGQAAGTFRSSVSRRGRVAPTCDMMRLRKQGGQRGGGRQRIAHTVIR